MFTGIITDIGEITATQKRENGIEATISCHYEVENIALGSSISHNGVCLTVTKKSANSYNVDISEETLSCTNLSGWKLGDRVNLERALKVGDELGGHIVSGHIDGIGTVKSIEDIGDNKKITFIAPENLAKYIAFKGSVAINGVSLTVNEVSNNIFCVNIINHTINNTNFSLLNQDDAVNIEIDVLARYVERLNHG